MRALILIFIFLVISALVIINNQNLYIVQQEDLKTFSGEYSSWIDKIYQNIRSITGQVINMEWVPNTSEIILEKNETTSNITNEFTEINNLNPSDDKFWDTLDWEITETKNNSNNSK